jgi:uncharacterized protein involved in outer membrane biogenesis
MKQSRKIVVGLAAVLLIIAGSAWLLYFNLATVVARFIVEVGSEATQTKVSVGGLFIDVKDGVASMERLTVANPDGFSNRPAIMLENLGIQLDPLAVTSDPLVIDSIAVDGARVLVEQEGSQNNLRAILSSIERQSGQPEDTDGRKLIIDRFELTSANATLFIPRLNEEHQLEMPDIVLTDIGRATDGATAAAVAEQLLHPLIRSALESAAAGGIGDALREKLDETEPAIPEGLLERLGDPNRENPDE